MQDKSCDSEAEIEAAVEDFGWILSLLVSFSQVFVFSGVVLKIESCSLAVFDKQREKESKYVCIWRPVMSVVPGQNSVKIGDREDLVY